MRYFFHVHDGNRSATDDEGTVLPDDAAARQEAVQALAEIAKDSLPRDGDNSELSVHVTDSAGRPLFSVRIDFHVDRVATT